LLTVVFATLAATLFTGYVEHDALNALALFGAALVVMGSICSSLGRK
jgi:drug/metabolite transporter (DMT)-like permease